VAILGFKSVIFRFQKCVFWIILNTKNVIFYYKNVIIKHKKKQFLNIKYKIFFFNNLEHQKKVIFDYKNAISEH